MVADGFGIGYIIKRQGISYCVTSKHRQTRRFIAVLRGYLLEVHSLM